MTIQFELGTQHESYGWHETFQDEPEAWTCCNLSSSPFILPASFNTCSVTVASDIVGKGGVSPLIFLLDDAALNARDPRGEAGSGVLLLGGCQRFKCTIAAFILVAGLPISDLDSEGV
jgi:hypothetical protein